MDNLNVIDTMLDCFTRIRINGEREINNQKINWNYIANKHKFQFGKIRVLQLFK
jgi:hypothetical protein